MRQSSGSRPVQWTTLTRKLIALLPLLIAILLPLLYHVNARALSEGVLLSLDDGYIHATLATNLANTGHLGINPGESSGGSSSLLWTILLAFLAKLGSPADFSALLLGILSNGLLVLSIHRLARIHLDERPAFIAALLTSLFGQHAALALTGMESLAAASFTLLGFTIPSEQWKRRCLVFAVATLTRIETLPAFYMLNFFEWQQARHEAVARASVKQYLLPLLVMTLVGIGGLALLSLLSGGLPSTLFGRRWLYGYPLSLLSLPSPFIPTFLHFLRSILIRTAEYIGPGGFAGIVWAFTLFWTSFNGATVIARRSALGRGLIGYLSLHTLYVFLVIGSEGHLGRYLAPEWSLLPMLTLLGCESTCRSVRSPALARIVRIGMILLLAAGLPQIVRWGSWHVGSLNHLARVHAQMAEMVKEKVPETETIAAFDIGLLAWSTDHRLLDLGGLSGMELVQDLYGGRITSRLKSEGVHYLLLPESSLMDGETLGNRLGIDLTGSRLLGSCLLPADQRDHIPPTRIAFPAMTLRFIPESAPIEHNRSSVAADHN